MKKRNISIHSIIWLLTVVLFSSFFILETSTIGSRILFFITLLILGLSILTDGGSIRLKIGLFQLMQVPFISFCFLSMIWAWNRGYASEKAITLVEIMICMTVLYTYYSKFDTVDSLLKVVMCSGFFTTIYSYFYYGLSTIVQVIITGSRIPSSFTNTNTLGMLAAISVVIAVYYIMVKGQRSLLLLIIPAVILIAATGSRKALILVVVGSGIVIIQNSKSNSPIKKVIYGILALLSFAVAIYFLSSLPIFSGINQRMQGMINLFTHEGKIDSSAQLRQNYILVGIRQFTQTPLLGIGIGNPRILTKAFFGHDAYLHNNFVELLCGGGITGFVLYYVNYIYLIFSIIRHNKNKTSEAIVILAMIAALLLIDYGSVSYYAKDTYFYFMIFYILVEKMSNNEKSMSSEIGVIK